MSQKRVSRGPLLVAVTLGALMLTACSILPGIDLAVDGKKNGAPTELGGYDFVRLTPEVIRRENKKKYPLEIDGKLVSLDAVPNDEAASLRYTYRVGPGDVLSVIVWGHPELTSPAGEFRDPESAGRLVDSDGTIFYPYVGELKVAGRTTQEIRRQIADGLSRVVREPQVDVRVASYRSKSVSVIGHVNTPLVIPMTDRPLTLLQSLAAAGGVREDAVRSSVLLNRSGQSYLVRLNSSGANVRRANHGGIDDVYAIHEISLRDGDTVIALHPNSQKVYVLGATASPSTVPIVSKETSLAEVLTANGGVNEMSANRRKIFVVRKQNKIEGSKERRVSIFQVSLVDLSDLVMAENFKLAQHDVVYVDRTGLASFNSVVSQILPAVSTIFQLDRVFLDN